MRNKKFYEFKNVGNESLDIMVYGEIVSGGQDSKWDSTDVCFQDFKDTLDNLGNTKTVNLYINSVGGSVITTQGIIAMLQRVKDKGVVVNSYIDGLGASCASFLPMISDNIYAYNSSILMIHKPMNIVMGNADDMQSQIDILNKFEDSVMLPLYMSKAKDGVTDEQIKDMLSKETWMDATEMSNIFDITILEDDKDLTACINDESILDNYKNIPKSLKDILMKESKVIEKVKDKAEEERLKQIQDNKDKEKQELELLKAKLLLELE
ncbi:head maturation protease, ClpP-related [Clostridium autoethanogenum]|uniref:Clp protease ClpP n=1 Tax=Clostridium autoethanogenum DSM 10061 TaxID=1341692 RepID=A0ABN4BPF7_9CLOT|nr:head maturation protease, ClpP-related [Clostridium autoethanogenum]AGY77982.1 Clp protease ClpP [Clostridium autoethanogenum DSM 10061]ALU38116.1 ClpP family serine protease [Clostridium autoethanogenum DSM 10061]OVY50880.1 ATP-dependent Clp protease proteolytic subunit [Clostridium autoethanogenum]